LSANYRTLKSLGKLPNAFRKTAFANSPLAGTTESHSADMSRSSRHLRRVMTLPGKKEKSRPYQPQTRLKSKLDAYYVPGVKR
jgi:hypothetical protein